MRFEFATAAHIVFGPGSFAEAGALARGLGRRALVLTGGSRRHSERLAGLLETAGVTSGIFAFIGEPAVETVLAALGRARKMDADCIIGLGGGSAIDAAKAVAGFLGNPGDPLEFLEVVGQGRPLPGRAAPWMAIPTTAGTGAEATRNAVLTVPQRGLKVSLRSPHLFARVALVDPALALDLPADLTAATGMDALTQLIEPYVCNRANPATDALCAAGLPRAACALRRLNFTPSDLEARTDMALAALWSGQALTNAGLGAVHGLAAPIGGMFSAPHGAVCAALLAPVMEANLGALRRRDLRHPALIRYAEVARWLTGSLSASADQGVRWVRDLVADLRLPTLRNYGVTPSHIPEIVARACEASSMKSNPLTLTTAELADVVNAATEPARG
jgi:alcohol dehydrogenase class IV